jgi:hypothetical protein
MTPRAPEAPLAIGAPRVVRLDRNGGVGAAG